MATLKILIADDQVLLAEALRTLIELEDEIRVVAIAGNGQQAYQQTLQLAPDVVLMDIQMPEMNGVESLRQIKRARPQTLVFMLTTFDNDSYVMEAMAAGADGFLLKDIRPEQLIAVIRQTVEGYCFMPTAVVRRLSRRSVVPGPGTASQPSADLSSREREIARLMAMGLTNQQIAGQLHLTDGTVKNYISVIYAKLGTSDRVQAIARLSNQEGRTGAGS